MAIAAAGSVHPPTNNTALAPFRRFIDIIDVRHLRNRKPEPNATYKREAINNLFGKRSSNSRVARYERIERWKRPTQRGTLSDWSRWR